ncbi:N-acetylmuramoyl-L-alanine amidase [uncultured Pseudoflavonifractor sp.]|uniref:N-acetylmuramoyl-L-alanine amidase n=1 Tax=uncultured Pseudoflavonifractor sp. TaxID=1221379 RepID=UPI0025D14BFE|nr:N-acetylmuramoyl-L-alanine amidase [uncultured Pseudoflavonifractor sp.]
MRQTKRAAVFLLMLALLVSFLPVQAAGPNGLLNIEVHNEATGRYEPQQAEKINISLDGTVLDLTGDVPGLALGSRTMVPIRTVAEALGATVLWPQGSNQVILRKGTDTIVLTLGAANAVVNGQVAPLPDGVPACVVKCQGVERTMVPLRFVSERLGAQVDWEQETFTAKIVSGENDAAYITRIQANYDMQTVFIGMDQKLEYRITDSGNRVTLDILGAELSAGFPGTIAVDNDFIDTVRYAQHGTDLYDGYDHVVRVELILADGVSREKNLTVEQQDDGILITAFRAPEDEPVVPDTPAEKPTDPVNPSNPIDPARRTIVIDPGHGGTSSGAAYEGILEKDLTLPISLKLEALLKAAGYNVVMTRSTDVYVGLYERADIANSVDADIFVSIHANAFDDPSVNGLITYYHPSSGRGRRLAQAIQTPACQATGAKDRSIASADFVVLRETDMCAVLVETGFMTNHDELMKLNTSSYQDKLAQGIAQGIINYLNTLG